DRRDSDLFMHDVIAYVLLAAVSCLSVSQPDARYRLHRVAWLVVTCGSVSLALQVANGWGVFESSRVDPWYWDRFRGWSANPNQLAVVCTLLAMLSFSL